LAYQQQRVLITLDKDFGELAILHELLRQDLKDSMAYLINKAKKVYASHEKI
jgi:hypothetical protein